MRAALLHQGSLEHANVGKLVGKRARAFRSQLAKVFDDPRVSPGEQAVEVANFEKKRIVAVGSDGDDALRRSGLADGSREIADALVGGDAFAVGDPDLLELPREIAIHINSGDDERPKKVALAAFVDAEVRLEHFRIEHLLIAQLGFAEDLGFQPEADKVFGASALNDRLRPFLINGDRQLVLLRKVERVGTRFEFVSLLT